MSFLLRTLTLLATIGFVRRVDAWFCGGHMLVAQVALDSGIMTPEVTAAVQGLVDVLTPSYPATGPTMVESACWADDLKSAATGEEASFHFIDLPVSPFRGQRSHRAAVSNGCG